MPAGLTPAEIDSYVVGAVADGVDLYHLETDALRSLAPTHVVTQDLCAVCAVDVSTVDAALAHLGCSADVLTVDPHTLEEVLGSVLLLGRATGRDEAAAELVQSLRQRMAAVWRSTLGFDRLRVAVLEWTDPPYAAGHWIPEMVELAGGENVLGTAGQKSVRVTWDDVVAAEPDVVVVAPCGYGRAGAEAQAKEVAGLLPPGVVVHPVDADAMWARPGPRLMDGIEELAEVLRRR
jgi:iron complex transport system substrate-binding protein